ncbi:MAG: hypothetical protein M1822_008208 [Bathelium mastoideum]|nr:MAG: hypothetical protein M1822_008208 [Bathelium mastoideum]
MGSTQPHTYPTDRHELSVGGLQSVIVSFIFTALATVAVILRFYVRRIKRVTPFPEDWMIVAALVVDWVSVVFVCLVAFDGGLGWQFGQASPEALQNGLKFALTGEILFNFTTGFVKVSICVTLMRIFPSKNFRLAAVLIAVMSVLFQISSILKNFLICKPLAHYWNKSVPGHCGNETVAYGMTGAVDLLTDIAIFILPIRPLSRLQMAPTKKLALYATFGLGLLTLIAGALRVYANIITDFGTDFVHSVPLVIIFTEIQAAVGIIVSCLILMRPLLDRVVSGYKNYQSRSGSGSRSTSGAGSAVKGRDWLGRSASMGTGTQKTGVQREGEGVGMLVKGFGREGTFLWLGESGDEVPLQRAEAQGRQGDWSGMLSSRFLHEVYIGTV